MPGMNRREHPFLLLLAAALLWSLGGVLIKLIPWSALTLAGMRSLVALVVFILWDRGWKVRWSLPMLLGAVCYAATLISFVGATKLTSAANAILLQYTAPVHIALFGAWFLGEKIRKRDMATIVLVLGGMTLFFLDHLTLSGRWGNLVGIFSGITFAWMILFLRRQKDARPLDTVILGNLLVVLTTLPFWKGIDTHPGHWGGILVLGALQIALPYRLYTRAICQVRAIEAILVPTLEPLLNPLWVFLFVGEQPGTWAFLGGAVVLGSVLGHQLWPAKHTRKSGLPPPGSPSLS